MRVHQTSLGLSHQTRLFGGSQGKLLLVADGLGGHESGERASTLAVDGVANYVLNAMDWFFRLNEQNEAEFEAELVNSFVHSQQTLMDEADAIPQRRGMATTLTMAYIDWPRVYVVHVGDTRCYHLSSGKISQLTKDHTMAQLISDGQAGDQANPEAEQPQGRLSNMLWNVVGGSEVSLEPQLVKTKLSVGDSLLLCSDGLTNYVDDSELLQLIEGSQPAQTTCSQLIDTANDRGGADNITAIVAKFVDNDDVIQAEYREADTTPYAEMPLDESAGDDVLVIE